MDNFDLKGFLRNNTLLKESLEEAKEEVKEEVKTEGYGKKMKKSELKEKIREEVLEAMSLDLEKDNEIADEEEAHSGVAEAEGDEDAPDVDADIDVDAELDIEEPAADEDDEFGDVGDEDVEGAEREAYDGIIAAGRAYKKLGEDADNGGLKTMMDQLKYLERQYNYPPAEDVFDSEAGI